MRKSIYISSLEKNTGTIISSLGIMALLKRRFAKVAFFKPIVKNKDINKDNNTNVILSHFNIDMPYDDAIGFSLSEIELMISQDRLSEILETLVIKYKKLEEEYDFILCEGISRRHLSSSIEIDINLQIAKNFNSYYVNVLNGYDKNLLRIDEEIHTESRNISKEKCKHLCTIVNKTDKQLLKQLQKKYTNNKSLVFFLPENNELSRPTIAEIQEVLSAKKIHGSDEDYKRSLKQTRIGAMGIDNFLPKIKDGDLIITPCDRSDIILGCIMANNSKEFASLCGIVITGDLKIDDNFLKLIKGIKDCTVPILKHTDDTFDTAMKISNIKAKITIKNDRKIALAQGIFSSNITTDLIENRLILTDDDIITPIMFEYRLFEKARNNKKTIVMPESCDDRILRAVEILLRRKVVNIILLGDEEEIHHKSQALGINIKKATIINPATSDKLSSYIDTFYELRKHKGISFDDAKEAMIEYTYFATMMVKMGDADGMVSGATHTTRDTIKPALQIIKTKQNISIVSSVFFMCLDTKVLVFGDCAVNPSPNASQLAQIALSSAKTANSFDISPRVAMLSYSSGSSGIGVEVEKVKEAVIKAKEINPNILLEGPMQYDSAIDTTIAKQKLPNSKVAGIANVFIFPDLNTGNNTYKAVQRSSNAIAIGPILQGLNKPVNDLSRGCLILDIVNTVAITAIQAQDK